MLGLLLRNRLRMLFYMVRKKNAKNRRRLIRLALIFFLPFWVTQSSFQLYHSWQFIPGFHPGVVANYITIIQSGLFFLMFMSGIPLALHYHYMSHDRALLVTAPISARTIFLYKCSELCMTNSVLYMLVGVPSLVAGIFAFNMSAGFYLPLLLALLLFIIIPSTLAALLASVTALLVPVKRARQSTSIVFGLVIIGVWIAIQFFNQDRLDPYSSGFDTGLYINLLERPLPAYTDWLPSAWIAGVFQAAAQHQWDMLITPLFKLALTAIALLTLSGWLVPQSIKINRERHEFTRNRVSAPKEQNRPLQINLALRDYKLQFRDSRFVTQFFFYMAISIVMPLMARDSIVNENETTLYLVPFISIVVITSLMGAGMAARSISLEKRSFFYNKIGPLSPMSLGISKLIVPLLASYLVMIIGLGALALNSHGSPIQSLQWLPVLGFYLAAVCALGLWIGTFFRTTRWDNPRSMLGESGNLVLHIAVLVYCVLTGGLVLILAIWKIWLAITVLLLLSVFSIYIFIRLNAQRLASITV